MHHLLNVSQKTDGTAIDDTENLFKDQATDFNISIAITDDCKSFKYKAKLLGNTEAQLLLVMLMKF